MPQTAQVIATSDPSRGECALRLGILGHYGTRNLGDEAIVESVLGALRELSGDIEPVGISMNPADTAERHGIRSVGLRSYSAGPKPATDGEPLPSPPAKSLRSAAKKIPPLKWTWRLMSRLVAAAGDCVTELRHVSKVFREVRRLDGVIIAGSGQFEDSWGGPMAFPYTLFKWSLAARLAGKPLAILSSGAGPIDRALSRWFLRRSVRWSCYASFRDEASAALMHAVSGRSQQVAPDLALGLDVDPALRPSPVAGHIGVNVMPIYDARYWHTADSARYQGYIEAVATAVADLCRTGYRVTLIATQPKDLLAADDLRAAIDRRLGSHVELATTYPGSVRELLEVLSTCEVLVASRLHALILAALVGTPAVGICKDEKQREFMRQVGAAGIAIPFETANADLLGFEIRRARTRSAESVAALREFVDCSRAAVRLQYARAIEEIGRCRSI
jgi:polysaccharide pyruvyl transferase WcaK-like protein